MADLSSIKTGVVEISTWFWGIFGDIFDVIVSNSLILWPVIFAIVAGVIGLGINVIRRFGIRGRR